MEAGGLVMEELLEGKLEALPRADEEMGWFEVWLATLVVTFGFLMCLMLFHAAMLRS